MRLAAFLGSPRASGNTDLLAQNVLAGASEIGLETQSVALRSLNVRPCVACEKCWRDERPCVQADDMMELYQTISDADILLFATPVYWYAPTAIMKAFIDRLVPFNRPQGRPLIQGKGVILVTAYEEVGPEAAEPLLQMFDLSFKYLGLRIIDSVVADGVGPRGAICEKPEVLARAYEIGCSLKTWTRSSES